jgi:hypothetical protein
MEKFEVRPGLVFNTVRISSWGLWMRAAVNHGISPSIPKFMPAGGDLLVCFKFLKAAATRITLHPYLTWIHPPQYQYPTNEDGSYKSGLFFGLYLRCSSTTGQRGVCLLSFDLYVTVFVRYNNTY